MATSRELLEISNGESTTVLIDEARVQVDGKKNVVLMLAHGAGAGIEHSFFASFVPLLTDRGITVVRYNFLYMEKGSKRPDRAPTCIKVISKVADFCCERFSQNRIFAAGKSMGGRMSSMFMAEKSHPAIEGLIFLGFPLHPAKVPGTERGEHLTKVKVPMLFLQGTRDSLADLTLLTPITKSLSLAELQILDGADHFFAVLKRSGTSQEAVLEQMADGIAKFVDV